jgi:hypothetical protein
MRTGHAEEIVCAALEVRGLRSERFLKSETRAGRKTPDRRVYREQEFTFYLEIKEIEDVLKHGIGDSILDRVAARIHDAVAQFDAVNPERIHPNVLAFVNRNPRCGALDLIEVVTGRRLLEGGETAPIGLRWSEGRIREEKWRVDLWLWFDCHKADQIFFNAMDERHGDRLASLFGTDPNSIPDVLKQHTSGRSGRVVRAQNSRVINATTVTAANRARG